MDYPSPHHNPENGYLESMALADLRYLKDVMSVYPAVGDMRRSGSYRNPGEYWGVSVAIVCAKLGLPIGFFEASDSDSPAFGLSGDDEALNYWLHLSSFEAHSAGSLKNSVAPDSESRSGLYVLLSEVNHSRLFEHIYAAYTKTPIEAVIQSDPMFAEIRHAQPATLYEIVDQEGIERLYEQDPEQCLRLYLTRQIPQLKNLRDTIRWTEASLVDLDEITDDMDDHTKKIINKIRKDRAEIAPFQQARLEYWRKEYDFTNSLLMEGYKPYSLEDIIPLVEGYLVSLLAEHPGLSPTNLQVNIPDIKAKLNRFIEDVKRRDKSELN